MMIIVVGHIIAQWAFIQQDLDPVNFYEGKVLHVTMIWASKQLECVCVCVVLHTWLVTSSVVSYCTAYLRKLR